MSQYRLLYEQMPLNWRKPTHLSTGYETRLLQVSYFLNFASQIGGNYEGATGWSDYMFKPETPLQLILQN